MGRLKQCTLLKLAALVVALGTVVAISIVATGALHDSRAESARRLTLLCRPMAAAITHETPAEMTVRDMLLLRQETVAIAGAMGELIKDADGDGRRELRRIRKQFGAASDDFGVLSITQRAAALQDVERRARAIGASCPSPLTKAEGAIVDRTLGARTPGG